MAFDSIVESLKSIGGFTDEELSLVTDRLETKSIAKNQYILNPDQICQSVCFVRSGALRQYKMVNEIDELTLNLYTENAWVMDHKSFTAQKPTENYIQATEDSEVQELTIHVIHDLIAKSPSFFRLGKILDLAQNDLNDIDHLKSPEEKYLSLLDTRP